ncbi:MAG: methyltransferase [Myxococcota bacterium]
MRAVPATEILLVHCGDLPGIAAGARRLILDVRERQDTTAEVHEDRLGPLGLAQRAKVAVVWPRAHLGKDFTHWCLVRAAEGVEDGGVVWCAVRKSKGADSVADAMRRLIGPVDVAARSKGYRLFKATRRGDKRDAWAAVMDTRYVVQDEALLPGVALASAPGVFSRRALDAGTATLMRYAVDAGLDAPAHVVDLCTGIGPLAIFAALRFPASRVTAVDSNLIAVALAKRNVEAHGLADRVTVIASDGLPPDEGAPRAQLALVNPPTHADAETLSKLWAGLHRRLAPNGRALVVAARAGSIRAALAKLGASITAATSGGYTVVDARWGLG